MTAQQSSHSDLSVCPIFVSAYESLLLEAYVRQSDTRDTWYVAPVLCAFDLLLPDHHLLTGIQEASERPASSITFLQSAAASDRPSLRDQLLDQLLD